MKFQNILLLLTACLLAGSCSDDDNDGAWFLPRTLQVMDAKTDAPAHHRRERLHPFQGKHPGGVPRCVQLLPRYGQRLFPFVPPGFRR